MAARGNAEPNMFSAFFLYSAAVAGLGWPCARLNWEIDCWTYPQASLAFAFEEAPHAARIVPLNAKVVAMRVALKRVRGRFIIRLSI